MLAAVLAAAWTAPAYATDATVTLTDDAFTNSAQPTVNNGTVGILRVTTTKNTYLKFTVSGIPAGGAVSGATLCVTPDASSSSQTMNAVAVADTTWTESTITWNNQPTIGST